MFNLILNDDIKTERNVILEERRWRRETNPQVCWTRRSTRRCGRSALPHSGQRLDAGDGQAERHRRIHDLQQMLPARTTPCWWWPATQSLRR